MSTRAHVELTDGEEHVLLYHHYDGYPEWLVPNLIQQARRLMEDDLTNPSYDHMRARPDQAALYFAEAHFRNVRDLNGRQRRRRDRDPDPTQHDEERWRTPLCSGFEVCDNHGLHGDIEWFYRVWLWEPERSPYRPADDREAPAGWHTEVFTPNRAYWGSRNLPDDISHALDYLDRRGELAVTGDAVRYLGELPEPGAVYEREYRRVSGHPICEHLTIRERGDWLLAADYTRRVDGEVEYQGRRTISPFALGDYRPGSD